MTDAVNHLSGPLDIATVDSLVQSLNKELTPGATLVFDLSNVSRVDSAALALLFEGWRRASAVGGCLTVLGAPPILYRLACLYEVDDFLASVTKQ